MVTFAVFFFFLFDFGTGCIYHILKHFCCTDSERYFRLIQTCCLRVRRKTSGFGAVAVVSLFDGNLDSNILALVF